MARRRDSQTLSAYEKSCIRSRFSTLYRGDEADTYDQVAREFNVEESTVRLLLFERQTEIGK